MSQIFLWLDFLILLYIPFKLFNPFRFSIFIIIFLPAFASFIYTIDYTETIYYELEDLRTFAVLSSLVLIDLDKLKRINFNNEIFIFNNFALLILVSIILDFFSGESLTDGASYKFATLANIYLINQKSNYSSFANPFIYFSTVIPLAKWLVFYYLYTMRRYLSFRLQDIALILFILVAFYLMIEIFFGGIFNFLFGRVFTIGEDGIVLRDGSRFLIWQSQIANSELFHFLPNYGLRYQDLMGTKIHDHNVLIYLISKFSILTGVIFSLIFFKKKS